MMTRSFVKKARRLSACLILMLSLSVLCAAQADVLTLPAGLKTIEEEAFYGDTSLSEVVLPEGLTTIGSKAFANSRVKWIYIPASVTSIADDAFEGVWSSAAYVYPYIKTPTNSYAAQWSAAHNPAYARVDGAAEIHLTRPHALAVGAVVAGSRLQVLPSSAAVQWIADSDNIQISAQGKITATDVGEAVISFRDVSGKHELTRFQVLPVFVFYAADEPGSDDMLYDPGKNIVYDRWITSNAIHTDHPQGGSQEGVGRRRSAAHTQDTLFINAVGLGSWTVSVAEGADWIHLTTVSGTADKITIPDVYTVDENTGDQSRTGKIRFSLGNYTYDYEIVQESTAVHLPEVGSYYLENPAQFPYWICVQETDETNHSFRAGCYDHFGSSFDEYTAWAYPSADGGFLCEFTDDDDVVQSVRMTVENGQIFLFKAGSTYGPFIKGTPVSSVSIESDNRYHHCLIGDSFRLTVAVYPETATCKGIDWSYDDRVVTVDENGLVTVIGEGYTEIYAVAKDNSGCESLSNWVEDRCVVQTPYLPPEIFIPQTGFYYPDGSDPSASSDQMTYFQILEYDSVMGAIKVKSDRLGTAASGYTVWGYYVGDEEGYCTDPYVDDNGHTVQASLAYSPFEEEKPFYVSIYDGAQGTYFGKYIMDQEEPSPLSWFTFSDNGDGTCTLTGYTDQMQFDGDIVLPRVNGDGLPVVSIGNDAFDSCYDLTGSITIPPSVRSIGSGAFWNCNKLNEVKISEGVTTIGEDAFRYCFSLDVVRLPVSVVSIADGAFGDIQELYVYGTRGAYSETWAQSKGYTFQVLSELDFSENTVRANMLALQDEYPEGMTWTNDNSYYIKGRIGGLGCVAFCYILSDTSFRGRPLRELHSFTYDDVRVGDILRINGDTHSVIVLEKNADQVVIAEGNYNSSIHWGRTLTRAQVEAADYLTTRYPD